MGDPSGCHFCWKLLNGWQVHRNPKQVSFPMGCPPPRTSLPDPLPYPPSVTGAGGGGFVLYMTREQNALSVWHGTGSLGANSSW